MTGSAASLLPAGDAPSRELLYRLLVENVTDYAICLLDPAGRVTAWTEGAERMLGWSEGEIAGRSFSIFYPQEDAAAGAPERDLWTATAGRCETVAWRRRRDGSRLWATVVITAIRDPAGRVLGFGQIMRDLTERKEVAERYEESRQRYRSLFENNPNAVCSFDLDGALRSANPAAARLTGYDEDDLVGRAFWSLLAPTERDRARACFMEAASGGSPELETALVHSGGRRVDLHVTLVPIAVAGSTIGVYAIAEDVTPRRRAEAERESLLLRERVARAEAETANRAKSDFLAVVSHELKTPLNAVNGFAQLLHDGDAGPVTEVQRRHLERIRAGAGQLLEIIEDVLGYARLDSGGEGVSLQAVELGDVLSDAGEMIGAEAAAKGLRLEVRLPEGGCIVQTDPVRARELLRNLLSNAVKFTDEGGVDAVLRREGGWAVVTVADTGPGIAPDDLPRIWEPFWQAESPLVRRAGGKGLGLSIARRLTALLGGDVAVESEPGRGTVFTLRLPTAG